MASPLVPAHDCPLCPRLMEFRDDNRRRHPDYFNGPVPAFGDLDVPLLIAGLAPGLHGANRTGRPFTGDYAGDLLYATLLKFGFAEGRYEVRPDDSLRLVGCRISNSVRCVPPENKPTGSEVTTCRQFLVSELGAMPGLKVIVALGQIAHANVVAMHGARQADHKFAHGAVHHLPGGRVLADSYHCSRYNTNTGRLTTEMFEDVFRTVRGLLAS